MLNKTLLKKWCVIFLGFFILIPQRGFALPRVAVLDLVVPPNAIKFGTGYENTQWDVKTFTAQLATVLSNTKKFEVIERNQLGEVNSERVFGEITGGGSFGAGRFGGADYCLLGELKTMVFEAREENIPYSNYTGIKYSGEIGILLRMINVGTGKIIVARSIEVKRVTKLVNDVSSSEGFLNDLLKEAAEKAVVSIIEGAYPPRVASVDGSTIYINKGIDSGYEVGTRLIVYSQGKEIIDPDTKQKLGKEEAPVGEIEITEVLDKMSKAKPVSVSIGEIQSGMVCRMSQEKVTAPSKPLTPGSSEAPIKFDY